MAKKKSKKQEVVVDVCDTLDMSDVITDGYIETPSSKYDQYQEIKQVQEPEQTINEQIIDTMSNMSNEVDLINTNTDVISEIVTDPVAAVLNDDSISDDVQCDDSISDDVQCDDSFIEMSNLDNEIETINNNVKEETIMETQPEIPVEPEISVTDVSTQQADQVVVTVDIPSYSTEIDYVIHANNTRDKVIAVNKSVKMILGRFYFIPVDSKVDSDQYASIKIFSDLADKIDVRYVKDGYACICPLVHGYILSNKERLAIIF